MKQKISGTTGAVIAVVALVIIFGILYRVYFYKPTLSPADVNKGLAEGLQKTQEYMKAHPGQYGAPSNVPSSIAGQAGNAGGQGR